MGGGVRDDSLQPEILGVLREVIPLGPLFVGQICELALKLHEGLLLNLFLKWQFQLARKGVSFRMEIMRGAIVFHEFRSLKN
jgi:hypothetical protein